MARLYSHAATVAAFLITLETWPFLPAPVSEHGLVLHRPQSKRLSLSPISYGLRRRNRTILATPAVRPFNVSLRARVSHDCPNCQRSRLNALRSGFPTDLPRPHRPLSRMRRSMVSRKKFRTGPRRRPRGTHSTNIRQGPENRRRAISPGGSFVAPAEKLAYQRLGRIVLR